MRDTDEAKILDLLEQKKLVHYTDLMTLLNVGMETARSRCVELAKKYPENIEYIRGLLRLKKSLTFDDLPLEKRFQALQKTLAAKEEAERKLKEKLSKNHLPHIERAIEEGNLKKIHEEIEKLKKLLGVP
jgi:DeoR/GlpR family transcriptional regulator of sugar metabolism